MHVSSAFANCLVIDAEEKFYTEHIGTTSDELLAIKYELGNEKLDAMEEELLGKFPNTYCYTKSIAEEAVLTHGSTLPICVFRPGMSKYRVCHLIYCNETDFFYSKTVLGSCEDPIPGWVDNLYGPISIVYGCAIGVLRVIHASPKQKAAFIPVDYCANMIMACACETAKAFQKS